MQIILIHKNWERELAPSTTLKEIKIMAKKQTNQEICLLYLGGSGELCEIASSNDLTLALSSMKELYQSFLIISIESRGILNYCDNLRLISRFSSDISNLPSIVFQGDPLNYSIIFIEGIKEGEVIKQYVWYSQKWNIENTGRIPWKNFTLLNNSKRIECKDSFVSNLQPGEVGFVQVLFRYLNVTEEKRTYVEEWSILDNNGVVFGPGLLLNCFVQKWEDVETIIEMGISIDDAIEALEKNQNKLNEAIEYVFDKQ